MTRYGAEGLMWATMDSAYCTADDDMTNVGMSALGYIWFPSSIAASWYWRSPGALSCLASVDVRLTADTARAAVHTGERRGEVSPRRPPPAAAADLVDGRWRVETADQRGVADRWEVHTERGRLAVDGDATAGLGTGRDHVRRRETGSTEHDDERRQDETWQPTSCCRNTPQLSHGTRSTVLSVFSAYTVGHFIFR